MSNEYEQVDRASGRRIQSMIDRAHFNDLYSAAVEIFLTKPPEKISDVQEQNLPQSIVAACGVRGLAIALDGMRREQHFTKHEDTEGGFFLIGSDSVIRYPRAFSAEVDPRIQNDIENLGSGLLDEAYLALGTDVKSQIRRYRTSVSPDEQMAVLEWLDNRCVQFIREAKGGINIEDFAYHPARLSPKLIGRFPHNDLTPTCLSIGIITASFLREAGSPVLQGGVMNTHYDSLRKLYFRESLKTEARARKDGFASVEKAARKAVDWGLYGYEDIGLHVATFARLMDGSWYCVDPNYRLSYHLNDFDGELLQKAYDDLIDISSIAKGVEVPVQLGHSSVSLTITRCLDLVSSFRMETKSFEDILTEGDTESLPSKVFFEIARQIGVLRDRTEDGALKTMLNEMALIDSELIYESLEAFGYWQEYLSAWETHVLHGMDIRHFIGRCKADQNFLRRRLEDISILPTIALQGLLAFQLENFIDDIDSLKNKHELIELGLPEYRIGCSVLSDLAVYTQAPLSPQFFLSYWPSRVPITETRGTEIYDKTDQLTANMRWLFGTGPGYPQQYGIIKEHLFGNREDLEE